MQVLEGFRSFKPNNQTHCRVWWMIVLWQNKCIGRRLLAMIYNINVFINKLQSSENWNNTSFQYIYIGRGDMRIKRWKITKRFPLRIGNWKSPYHFIEERDLGIEVLPYGRLIPRTLLTRTFTIILDIHTLRPFCVFNWLVRLLRFSDITRRVHYCSRHTCGSGSHRDIKKKKKNRACTSNKFSTLCNRDTYMYVCTCVRLTRTTQLYAQTMRAND